MSYYQGDYYMAGQQLPRTGTVGSGIDWGAIARGTLGIATQVLPGILGKGVGAAAQGAMPGLFGGTPGLAAFTGAGLARPGGRRYRRMNVTNVKALRRGMRRVQGFAKLARSTIGFTQRVKMKKRRRR